MIRFPDVARAGALRRAGLWALILCTACLAVENALLLSWAATARPWALLAAASATLKAIFALSVPFGLILLTGVAAWLLPTAGARKHSRQTAARWNGGRDE